MGTLHRNDRQRHRDDDVRSVCPTESLAEGIWIYGRSGCRGGHAAVEARTVVRAIASSRDLMSDKLPIVYLARYGETAWTISGQHTGLTDLPLTERGECTARRLGERLKGLTFAAVLTSPLQRAARTCELAGFKSV